MTQKINEKTKPHHPSETEIPVENPWELTDKYISGLTFEPGFIAFVEEQNITDTRSFDYANALSDYSEQSITQQGELLDADQIARIRLVGNAAYITHASQQINHYSERRKQNERLSEDEWDHFNTLKEQAVWYNQMLGDYYYSHPDESYSNIAKVIIGQAIDHTAQNSHAESIIQGVVSGMRTEAAARHLLEAANVPFRPATAEEDLEGADIVLTLQNEYAVDIKKSLDKLAGKSGGYNFTEAGKMYSVITRRNGKKSLQFFPGFTDSELGDSLRLDEATTADRKDIVAAQLMRASIELAA